MVLSRHLLIMACHLLDPARFRVLTAVVLHSQRQRVMKHFQLPVLLLAFLLAHQADAQLAIDNSQTATALVQNVLLGGGVAVSNITFNGNSGNAVYEQLSGFNSSNSNVGILNGVGGFPRRAFSMNSVKIGTAISPPVAALPMLLGWSKPT